MSETHLVSWRKCVRFRVLCHINLGIGLISFQKIYTYLEYLIISGIISGISNYYYPVELQVADIQQNKDYPPIPFGVDKHIITFLKWIYRLFWPYNLVYSKIVAIFTFFSFCYLLASIFHTGLHLTGGKALSANCNSPMLLPTWQFFWWTLGYLREIFRKVIGRGKK